AVFAAKEGISDKKTTTVIAKIAELPPQQAKTGLAGDPRLPKVTIEKPERFGSEHASVQSMPVLERCQSRAAERMGRRCNTNSCSRPGQFVSKPTTDASPLC